MSSYQIISTGTPIVPYTIEIESSINVSQQLVNNITIPYDIQSQEFADACALVVSNAENAYKTLPEFTVQDEERIGTYSVVSTGGFTYDITMSWTIENATIKLQASTSTDLQGQALDDYLQVFSDSKVSEFKNQWNWIAL